MRLSTESHESITITTRTCTTQYETVKYMSASVGVTVGTRESLTIMWDSDATCGNAEISTQSQIGLL